MDPYTVGYLMGSAIPLGAIGFFVGRKLVGPSGVSEVERLSMRAGLAEPGAKPPSRFKGLVPFALGLGGALVGLGFGAQALVEERRANQVEGDDRFLAGCQRTCVEGTGDAPGCQGFCGCAFADLKRQYPTSKQLDALFAAVSADDEAARNVLQESQARCMSTHAPAARN